MSRIKNGGLDQYGAGPFEQQQFGTAGVEGVKTFLFSKPSLHSHLSFAQAYLLEFDPALDVWQSLARPAGFWAHYNTHVVYTCLLYTSDAADE